MRSWIFAAALALSAAPAATQPVDPAQSAFRAIYEEMVETDTSATTGACTTLARKIEGRLRVGGFPTSDVHLVIPTDAPDDGNVAAILPGQDPKLGALVLLAHIDVVDARREDWARDPFTLIEENGYFFGRGASDDKAMASIFLDLVLRLKAEGAKPRRAIKLVLTCGEETGPAVNGVKYLIEHRPDLISGAFALNEGAGGRLDSAGRKVALDIQAGEKVHQVWRLEVVNPGGHSSRPRADNAIYQLADALERVRGHAFPLELNSATRSFLQRMAPITGGEVGAAMTALANVDTDAAAAARLSADAGLNSILRTTCVATRLDAGHADNALPQRARATLSCRVLPGHSPEEVKAELTRVIADPEVTLTLTNGLQPSPPAPPLTADILGPVERVAAKMWPGVPVIPAMAAGATDGRHLTAAGTPTYGLSGLFALASENNAHGLDEKIRVRSLYEGRDFLEAVVREYVK